MYVQDWRNASPDEVRPLFGGEAGRWRALLSWEAAGIWDLAAEARTEGRLPGFLAREASGHIAGWTFFGVSGGVLQVGALAGQRADVVRALLEAVLASPESQLARRYQCFVFPESPSVEAALVRRRFGIEPYHYLVAPLPLDVSRRDAPVPLAPWRGDLTADAVRLIARSYAGQPSAACFAPNGRLDEWVAYCTQVLRTPACGDFVPEESFVANGDHESGLAGAVLTTRLSSDTAHLAQVVVDPAARGRGLGPALVSAAAAAAARRGAVRLTLLVGERNAPAVRIYASLGFARRATFLFGARDRITRLGAKLSPVRAAAQTIGSCT
jgi:ribosomal protein S18 acetylase RimI-like enzyme